MKFECGECGTLFSAENIIIREGTISLQLICMKCWKKEMN